MHIWAFKQPGRCNLMACTIRCQSLHSTISKKPSRHQTWRPRLRTLEQVVMKQNIHTWQSKLDDSLLILEWNTFCYADRADYRITSFSFSWFFYVLKIWGDVCYKFFAQSPNSRNKWVLLWTITKCILSYLVRREDSSLYALGLVNETPIYICWDTICTQWIFCTHVRISWAKHATR